MAYAVAWLTVSIVLKIGAEGDSGVGILGLKLTGVIAGVFSLLSFIVLFFYNDKRVIRSMETMREQRRLEDEESCDETERNADPEQGGDPECNREPEQSFGTERSVG